MNKARMRCLAAWYALKARALFRLSAWASKPSLWLWDRGVAARHRGNLLKGKLSPRKLPFTEQTYWYRIEVCDAEGNPIREPTIVLKEKEEDAANETR